MNFDPLARHYHWMEFLTAGTLLDRCRIQWLERCAAARDILIFGEGDGRFLAALRRVNREAHVMVVDSSEAMLKRARNRLLKEHDSLDGIQWLHADARDWMPLREGFDCVVTHFFLDCFQQPEVERLIPRVTEAMRQGGSWLLAEFRLPSSGVSRLRARWVLALAYLFFRWTVHLSASALPDIESAIAREGLGLVQRRTFNWGLLHSDVWVKRV